MRDLRGRAREPAGEGRSRREAALHPQLVDTDAITPQPRDNLLARQRGWVGACIVMYSGNVGHSQGLGVLLDIAPQLGGVRLVIVGQGAGHRALQGAARTRALGNVEFHGFAERAELPLLLAAADVSLVMMRPELSVESVPSKLYAIMSSARPVLLVGSPDSDAWRLVARARAGVCVRHGDQAALVRAVMQLRDDPDLCARLGANGRWYAVEHGSRKAGVQRYTSLVASLRVADVCSSWPSGTCER
ncbi:MAG: glycosyltransferase [Planctomycetota bacterium]